MLNGKHILLGITGGIAAYKSATLVREFIKRGAEVKVVMTPLAKQFISPLTMATLSQNPIMVDFFNPENGEWNSHVKMGLWADAYVLAPATANSIAKMASGIADNLLLTTYLSARCPVFVSAAMDYDMFLHPSTARNLKQLEEDGVKIISPRSGFLASGLSGKGRMEEPEEIANVIERYFAQESDVKDLEGKKVVITTGGTIEPIDSVRYISNYSSGKMGYALAEESLKRGADVTLIRASVLPELIDSIEGVKEISALSAEQICHEAVAASRDSDIIIMAAAIADFTPEVVSNKKIKKSDSEDFLTLKLKKTVDVAAKIGSEKREGQLFVGFALETDSEEVNALKKLEKKRLDMIVLNSLNDKGAGFMGDTNKITIFNYKGERIEFPLKSKSEVACDIINEVSKIIEERIS